MNSRWEKPEPAPTPFERLYPQEAAWLMGEYAAGRFHRIYIAK